MHKLFTHKKLAANSSVNPGLATQKYIVKTLSQLAKTMKYLKEDHTIKQTQQDLEDVCDLIHPSLKHTIFYLAILPLKRC
jgi:glucose-6-phosphate 1-dehydrogenase